MKKSSAVIIGISIIIGFAVLGLFLMFTFKQMPEKTVVNAEYRYDFIPANDNNIIIFDKQSGEYWVKFLPSNEGPTNWEKGDSPVKSDTE